MPDLNIRRFGDAINYTQFDSQGTMTFKGSATVWKDINFNPLKGVAGGPTGTAPDVLTIGKFRVHGFDGVDTVEEIQLGIEELPHTYKEGSDLYVHVHWSPRNGDAGDVKWVIGYTIANEDEVYSAETEISGISAAAEVAHTHQRTNIGIIDGSSLLFGAQIKLYIYRDPTDVEDTYESDAILNAVGIHFEVDTVGSRTQELK